MRLSRYLAHGGVSSRRAAEELIRAGRVTVGGETVTDPARDVGEHSGVAFDGAPVRPAPRTVVYVLNKPRGVVSTAKDTHGRRTVVELVRTPARIYPVGRLDADSTGLILLTDDGELANRLTHPRFEVPKTYLATVARPPVREHELRKLREGVQLDDGRTTPARVRRISPTQLEITIHEGRKRQIRRMLDAVGHPVKELQRIAFGPLRLTDLAEGASRRLTPAEVEQLRRYAPDRGGAGGRAPRARR
ncbi:pseudouridine synthase [Capillimicrobium parvum]|uniref:Pseudouridine synthase n=1 Tax=Capillimicrobium parvum TaxID=2884022 RepID=A0A9E6XWI4_9ACTN|nr:pseudouridine synthase [Capillimicrobium parvum]UGS35792.1 Ribosomal large subunit pseudouridine synthase B [Capillimicrobium parvum]